MRKVYNELNDGSGRHRDKASLGANVILMDPLYVLKQYLITTDNKFQDKT